MSYNNNNNTYASGDTRSVISGDYLSGLSEFTSLDGGESLSVSNRDYYVGDCEILSMSTRPVFALEKHITVIRKGPSIPPLLEMHPYEESDEFSRADVNMEVSDDAVIHTSFWGSRMHQSSNWAKIDTDTGVTVGGQAPNQFDAGYFWGDDEEGDYNKYGTGFDKQDISMFYKSNKEAMKTGDNVNVPINIDRTGEDWQAGDHILIEHEYADSFGSLRKATARLQLVDLRVDGWIVNVGPPVPLGGATLPPITIGYGYYPCNGGSLGSGDFCAEPHIVAKIVSITGNFPQGAVTDGDLYTVKLIQKPAIFEVKFPRFSYRYKYVDGEYSVFAPWSEIAFIPGQFDYLPKKGYNLGMQNRLRTLNIKNWVPKNIPKDVVQVDILYKESNSPNIYTVSSHKPNDPVESGKLENYWNLAGNGGHNGFYTITSELIHKVVKSNQLLRPWDNVPKKAKAQEVTANRLIFANYVQNYDLMDVEGDEVKASFMTMLNTSDYTTGSVNPRPGFPGKSLKSMRTYQLGVVYRDKYGRETPVMTSESGSIKLPKSNAKLQNRLSVQLQNKPPHWAESFTFYIKETSNEFYNLSMDRWYDAEDGGVWLSFPSSERNKITDRTNLILKKQHDTDIFTDFDTTYKVLSIKNDAPTFIRTDNKYWGSLPMMLPPPGWATLGSWDSGMFYNTGLPLPNRMFLDIFAEYWDQSSFNELSSMAGAQIRIVQSIGQASSYNAATSDTTNKTKWYDISSISYIGSPAQTQEVTDDSSGVEITSVVELPGQQEQLVRVSLEKVFGQDALFCEPSDNLSLARGLSIEARTKIVRDKSQFEGRFFVKVLRDTNIEANIVNPQLQTEDKYQVLFSRKLKYICAAHPGLQDWSKRMIHRDGVLSQEPNFIPVAINQHSVDAEKWGVGANSIAEGVNSGINESLYSVTSTSHPDPRIVSSLSSTHSGKAASFINAVNNPAEAPNGTGYQSRMWPFGPGGASIGAFDSGGWESPSLSHHKYLVYFNEINKLVWPSYREDSSSLDNDSGIAVGSTVGNGSGGYPTYTDTELKTFSLKTTRFNDWPSFGPERYSPYLKYGTRPDGTCVDCANNYAQDATGPYNNRVPDNITPHDVISINGAPALDGTLSNSSGTHLPINVGYKEHNYTQGANSTMIPAIWGNQESFFRGGCSSLSDCLGGDFPYVGTHEYNTETFTKLREDWHYLWHGRTVSDSWPLGKFSPQRWIIDKAGAAQGHSGNGIWANETTGVGYMDISFWGVGRGDTNGLKSRKHGTFADTLAAFNENEFGFATALRTPGTQFRFRYDPDKIVYTITGVVENDVYNYEAPQGVWGADDGNGKYGGSGIGFESVPPHGGILGDGAMAGGEAFISDLFSKDTTMIGSHPTNRRIRWTLTLDKIIGAEGDNKFHPITNHVDVDGVANLEIGRAKYNTNLVHVTGDKGGTPSGVEFYNLASYWNTTRGTGTDPLDPQLHDILGGGDDHTALSDSYGDDINGTLRQPDKQDFSDPDNFYTRNPFAHIGLHERGLNQTEIEIVTPYRGEDRDRPMSTNPAIWETEPMEDVGLDIYYAASPSYPVSLDRYRIDDDVNDVFAADWYDYSYRGEDIIKVGSTVEILGSISDPRSYDLDSEFGGGPRDDDDGKVEVSSINPVVCNVQGSTIWLTSTKLGTESAFHDSAGSPMTLSPGTKIKITWRGEGSFYGVGKDEEWATFTIKSALSNTSYKLEPNVHEGEIGLGYFNCWSYNNGVETNRVRDDYNAITIDKGVKASMPLATPYKEERRGSGLIFSGIYNSTSGVNETNQFIQAEPITKDLNPINGSIQKLFARDTDLVTFCENKVFKILAKKDALFNADGNTNVTSNAAVLGQSIPFTGEYGISRNPESFASESYRVYFTDKDRGSVLRLSKDGLTAISDQGMKDWFRDNLYSASSLRGSYDDRDDQYNLTIETADQDGDEKAYTVSYTEKKRGWVSFKSFVTQDGVSHKNNYYTFPSNKYSRKSTMDPWGVSYSTKATGRGEIWEHSLDLRITRHVISYTAAGNVLRVEDNGIGALVVGMVVEGNGIPVDTGIHAVECTGAVCAITLRTYSIGDGEGFPFEVPPLSLVTAGDEILFTAPRNNFYGNWRHYSMVKTLFNGDKGTVKRFKTLDYEGTQSKVKYNLDNYNSLWEAGNELIFDDYHDNFPKSGWSVNMIKTDLQEGKVDEFIDKENKWFSNIISLADAGIEDGLDTSEFSIQGLGFGQETK